MKSLTDVEDEMGHRVLAGIVSYNPDIARLTRNVDSVLNQADQILIVDNASKNITDILKLSKPSGRVTIIQNTENKGIAKALNQIGQYAKDNGYPYFLTLDQDSISDASLVNALKSEMVESKVAMVCPYICLEDKFVPQNTVLPVKSAITSGSLVRTEAWEQVGGFWEYLFIDEVDHEFCYVLRKNGYTILQTQSVAIEHIIGQPITRTVFGHVFQPTNHSAFRKYYIVRNSVIMKRLYPEEKEPFPHRYLSIFRMTVSMLLCEEQKLSKLSAILRGIVDAVKWIHNNDEVVCRKE